MAPPLKLVALVRWSVTVWSAAFVTLFALGLRWTALEALVYHRRVHDSAEAPVLAGHLSADVAILLSGLVHGTALFSQTGNEDVRAAELLPVQARLWKHLTLRWTVRRLRSVLARVWLPLALTLLVAYAVQSQRAYGKFLRAAPPALSTALALGGGEGRFESSLAPWTWPLAHIVRYTLSLYAGVYVVVSLARLTAALAALFLSCTVHSRFLFSSLHVTLLLLVGGVWGGGVARRYASAPLLNANTLRYSTEGVAAPFYDSLFTPAWAHAPSFASGVFFSYWLASAPPRVKTSVPVKLTCVASAGVVLLLSAVDVTGWILLFPESSRRLLLALYLPLYALCASFSLSVALRSTTLASLLESGLCGRLAGALTAAQPVTLWLTLLHPFVVVGMILRVDLPRDPHPGVVAGLTCLSLLATLPPAWLAAVMHTTLMNSVGAAMRSDIARAPFRLARAACARRFPLLSPLLLPHRGGGTGGGDAAPPAPPPAALHDAWLLGGNWRDRLARGLRRRREGGGGGAVPLPPPAHSPGGGGARGSEGDEDAHPRDRLRLVSAYILTRLAEESEARADGHPPSSTTALDGSADALSSVSGGVASLATGTLSLARSLLLPTTPARDAAGPAVQVDEGAAGRISWSRSPQTGDALVQAPLLATPPGSGAAADSDDDEGDGEGEGAGSTPRSPPPMTATLRAWYLSASVTLAQQWCEASDADEATRVALMKQVADDLADVVGETERRAGGGDEEESEGGEEEEEEEEVDAGDVEPGWSTLQDGAGPRSLFATGRYTTAEQRSRYTLNVRQAGPPAGPPAGPQFVGRDKVT